MVIEEEEMRKIISKYNRILDRMARKSSEEKEQLMDTIEELKSENKKQKRDIEEAGARIEKLEKQLTKEKNLNKHKHVLINTMVNKASSELVKWRVVEAYHNYVINDDRALLRTVFPLGFSPKDATVINSVFDIEMEEENLLSQERYIDALIEKLEEKENNE